MKHIFKKGSSDTTLVLLHGTGADEYDLLDLANEVSSDANILSIRGNVLENGRPRFFVRLGMNQFDMDSLKTETKNLYNFILEAVQTYELDANKLVVLGYSNGANIAVNMMLTHPQILAGAMLLHPLLANKNINNTPLTTKTLITAGVNDPIITQQQSQELYEALKQLAPNTEINEYMFGHSISFSEVDDMKKWYAKNFN